MFQSFTAITNRLFLLVTDYGIPLPPGAAVPAPGQPAPIGDAVAAAPPPDAVGFPPWIWLMWGALIVGMYFLMIRPQRRREKKMREMQGAIKTGDDIVTNGGLFGKVADVGEDCFIVEFGTNKGVRIPVLKGDVAGIRTPKMTPIPKDPE